MELYKVHTKILTPFTKETLKALKTMAAIKGKAETALQESIADFTFKGFAVAVVAKTYGSIEGKVLMHFSNEAALEIGKKVCASMLGDEPDTDEMNDEVSEAVTEFANTIIGLATRTLYESDLKIRFNPPIFIYDESDMELLMEGVQEILTVPIQAGDVGEFYFSYLLHNMTE